MMQTRKHKGDLLILSPTGEIPQVIGQTLSNQDFGTRIVSSL